jgi:hypothetical protein
LRKIGGHGKIWSRKWLALTGAKPKGHDDEDIARNILETNLKNPDAR